MVEVNQVWFVEFRNYNISDCDTTNNYIYFSFDSWAEANKGITKAV